MNTKIPIIFEDNHLLVVEKPPNILSQGDRTGDKDMLNLLKADIKERYNKPGKVYLGLVHRLDRPVGGVMIFAKTSKAASRLSDQIRRRVLKKTYMAVIHGIPSKKKGILTDYLLKNSKTNRVSVVNEASEGAKKAILDYEVLSTEENFTSVKINLHTGRPHQIRVQFSNIGHPLYGDQRYGSKLNKKGDQIALWSHEIICQHPTLKKEMRFESFPGKSEPWNWF